MPRRTDNNVRASTFRRSSRAVPVLTLHMMMQLSVPPRQCARRWRALEMQQVTTDFAEYSVKRRRVRRQHVHGASPRQLWS